MNINKHTHNIQSIKSIKITKLYFPLPIYEDLISVLSPLSFYYSWYLLCFVIFRLLYHHHHIWDTQHTTILIYILMQEKERSLGRKKAEKFNLKKWYLSTLYLYNCSTLMLAAIHVNIEIQCECKTMKN